MFEKRWAAIDEQTFTSNGTTDGKLTIDNAQLFRVKQHVVLKSNIQQSRILEIKRIVAPDIIYVGEIGAKITQRTDISAFLLIDAATLRINEQPRSSVPEQEIERLTYEEEPVVARRVFMVDEFGNPYDIDNPFPVNATISIGGISVDLDASTGDNVAISAHPTPVFYEVADTITTDTYEQIFSYTSLNSDTRIIALDVAVSTPSTIRVLLDGVQIREKRSSALEKNIVIQFHEHRPLPLGKIVIVEAKVERKIWPTYTTFTSMDGYIA